MGIILYKDTRDITYHYPNNVLSDANLSTKLKKLNLENRYIITQQTEFRPDLISNLLYATDEYSWVILFINGLTVDELVVGTEIKFPSINVLNSFLAND